ncbi:MAG: hypothetical protein R3303_15300 [Marinobacter sp.]|nr:hypothetical protein [Marinobacter sp.]
MTWVTWTAPWLVFWLSVVSPVAAGADVRLAVPHITSLLEADGSGVYQRLVSQALKAVPFSVEQHFYPYKRALRSFERLRADCVYSFTDVLQDEFGRDNIIASFPLGKFSFYLFTRQGEPALISTDQLPAGRVGGVIGHESYLRQIMDDLDSVLWVTSDEQNLEMLRLGRINAMIAAIPDIRPYLDNLNYAPGHPLLVGYDRITCHDTDKNRAFLSALSEQLIKLKDAGIYQAVAGSLYVDFDTRTWLTSAGIPYPAR